MKSHPDLQKLIRVASVELHDASSGDEKGEWGCAYRKVFGTTDDGDRVLLWDCNKDMWIYRQYGSHRSAPCRWALSRAMRMMAA